MSRYKKNKGIWIGLALSALILLGISVLQLQGNLVYFYTPSEAFAKGAEVGNRTIRIGGMVKKGTKIWSPENLDLRFVVTDYKGHEIATRYNGTPPDLFKEGQGVVIEGKLDTVQKSFQARKLMVKHSEEYQKPNAEHSIDKELLKKSIFKN
jgi:cytochrome c-type biogenesis protein CcmE